MDTPDAKLEELFTSWCNAFHRLDSAAMKSLWDHSGGVIYQAEELDYAMFTADAVNAYWDEIPKIVETIAEWRPVGTHYLQHGDSATIYSRIDTDIRLAQAKQPIVGQVRVTLGVRRVNEAWKIISIHESRALDLAPYL